MAVMPGSFALLTVLVGNAVMVGGSLLAQTASGGPGDLAPWISGAGSVTAVGGIVYIARLMATGQLVARDPAAETEALKDLVRDTAELTRRVTAIAEAGADRERTLHDLLVRKYEVISGRRVPREEDD